MPDPEIFHETNPFASPEVEEVDRQLSLCRIDADRSGSFVSHDGLPSVSLYLTKRHLWRLPRRTMYSPCLAIWRNELRYCLAVN